MSNLKCRTMLRSSFSILFSIRESKVRKNGNAPIEVTILGDIKLAIILPNIIEKKVPKDVIKLINNDDVMLNFTFFIP